jgi:carbonic anhydrase
MQFAVDVLKVKHVIVCGHYGCGGVTAAMSEETEGPIDQWLSNIRAVYRKHKDELALLPTETQRVNRMVELNVLCQVQAVAETSIIQNAREERDIQIHAWVYDISDGMIKELAVDAAVPAEMQV